MKAEHKKQLAVFMVIALLFCAGGIVCILFGIGMYIENRAFADRAIPTEGKVAGFEKWESGTGFDRQENLYYATILYKAADGREVRFRGPSRDGLVKLKRGDSVRVLYDSANPEAARVDSFMGLWFGATMLCGLGVGAILIPLLTLWHSWKWVKRQERNDA
jgi:hypothetical protein